MIKQRPEVDDEDDEDRQRTGPYLRVPLTMMDSLDPIQRAVARDTAPAGSYERYCADAAAEAQRHREIGATRGGRPGYAPLTDQQRQQRDAAYLEYCRQLSERWRKPAQPKAADSTPAPQRSNDAEKAREEYVQRTSNAWRKP